MPELNIVKEEPITLAELKKHLDGIKKTDQELNFRSNKTHEYVHQLDILSVTKSKELKKKIEDLGISRLKEEHLVKLVDSVPIQRQEQVKQLFQGYPLSLNNADIKKIFDVLSEYS